MCSPFPSMRCVWSKRSLICSWYSSRNWAWISKDGGVLCSRTAFLLRSSMPLNKYATARGMMPKGVFAGTCKYAHTYVHTHCTYERPQYPYTDVANQSIKQLTAGRFGNVGLHQLTTKQLWTVDKGLRGRNALQSVV